MLLNGKSFEMQAVCGTEDGGKSASQEANEAGMFGREKLARPTRRDGVDHDLKIILEPLKVIFSDGGHGKLFPACVRRQT